MKAENSSTGTHQGEFYRDAGKCSGGDGGLISYEFETNRENSLSLMVRYWGNEGCTREFDIKIDDEKLVTENISGKWNKDEFVNETYAIPDNMVKGKKIIRVSFTANSGMVGGIFGVRLLRNKPKPEQTTVAAPSESRVARPDLKARIMGDELQIAAGTALSQGLTAKIFSINGRLVKSQMLPAGQSAFSIGIADMKSGMYILKIQRDGMSFASSIFRKER
jgi:hypothetical protein